MLPKAIFFDLDDTLLSDDAFSEQAWIKSCEIFADKRGVIKSRDLFDTINETRKWFWNDADRRREGSLNLYKARTTIVETALKRLGCDDHSMADEIIVNYARIKDKVLDFSLMQK